MAEGNNEDRHEPQAGADEPRADENSRTDAQPSSPPNPEDSRTDAREPQAERPDEEQDPLQRELEAAQQRERDAEDKYLRAQAEMQNVRRSAEREVQNALVYGTEKLVAQLLPALDNLDRALDDMSERYKPEELEGLVLTRKLLLDGLAQFGVREINPEGEVFDPQLHEALTAVPAPDKSPGLVLEVMQKGYTLAERVVRAASVVISAEPAPQEDADEQDDASKQEDAGEQNATGEAKETGEQNAAEGQKH